MSTTSCKRKPWWKMCSWVTICDHNNLMERCPERVEILSPKDRTTAPFTLKPESPWPLKLQNVGFEEKTCHGTRSLYVTIDGLRDQCIVNEWKMLIKCTLDNISRSNGLHAKPTLWGGHNTKSIRSWAQKPWLVWNVIPFFFASL
jgi:hypothetical protein